MNNLRKSLLLCALLSTAISAAAKIETCPIDGTRHALARAYESDWRNAVAAASPAEISRLYAESAVFMPPTDETIVGRDLIASYLSSSGSIYATDNINIDLVSCTRDGKLMHIAAVWGKATPEGHWQSGNLVRVLQQEQTGRWLTRYEIWN